jgi:WXG100 family type VII secretion target
MVQYRVRTESLGEVANLLQSVVSTFDAHVSETDSVVRSVVDSSWEGEDATLFDTNWQEFQAGAAALRAVLSSLAGRLQAAEGGYGSTETGLSRPSSGRVSWPERGRTRGPAVGPRR